MWVPGPGEILVSRGLDREAESDALMRTLDVQVDAFATCEIGERCALAIKPFDSVIVHYVLEGHGSVVTEHGSLPISAGMTLVIPRGLAKQINGRGPIETIVDGAGTCELAPGIMKFGVSKGANRSLVLGCASVKATVFESIDLFSTLVRPVALQSADKIVQHTIANIIRELSQPSIGTKAIIDNLMKQVLLFVLRKDLENADTPFSAVRKGLPDQFELAVQTIDNRPQDTYTVAKLARIAGMSRSCFAAKFVEEYGISPMVYVRNARLSAASDQLMNTTLPVKSIAAAVGYASRSHFARAFAAVFGTDPTQFRRLSKTSMWPGRQSGGVFPEGDSTAVPCALNGGGSGWHNTDPYRVGSSR